jgi:hypothetical protein
MLFDPSRSGEQRFLRVQPSLFISHSLSRGHFSLVLFPSQSPQMVISWLQGLKTSALWALATFLFFALCAFSTLVTFDIILILLIVRIAGSIGIKGAPHSRFHEDYGRKRESSRLAILLSY